MTRKIIINNKDIQLKYREELNSIPVESMELSHNALIERAGGSISNLPVKTKEFADWIEDQQKNRNPLIGKQYITSASEYNTEQFKLGDDIELKGNSAIDLIKTEEGKAFDVDASQEIMNSNIGESDDNHDTKFIDMVIIENATQKLLTTDIESVLINANDELKKYHNNNEYQTEINALDVIEQTQLLMIEEQKNHTKLLK